jgi:hypothetical protein
MFMSPATGEALAKKSCCLRRNTIIMNIADFCGRSGIAARLIEVA